MLNTIASTANSNYDIKLAQVQKKETVKGLEHLSESEFARKLYDILENLSSFKAVENKDFGINRGEDIAADLVTHLLEKRKAGMLDNVQNLSAFCNTAFQNKLNDAYRKQRTDQKYTGATLSALSKPEDSGKAPISLEDLSTKAPDELASQKEVVLTIRDLVNNLNDDEQIIAKTFKGELSNTEAADRLGIKEATLKARKGRLKQILLSALEPYKKAA